MGNFALSHVVYITNDFKMLVSDLSHAGSALVVSDSIQRKSGLSE